MIKILGLFGQIAFKNFTLLHIITRNYTKKKEDIRYALLRLITANYTQSIFEKNKKNIFVLNCYRVITRCYRLRRNFA
jgi:hypothetical protein